MVYDKQHAPKISIHAPTRGATLLIIADVMEDKISIHAPTRGATYCKANGG